MWFEIKLSQNSRNAFPMEKADSREEVIDRMERTYPYWEIVRVTEIPHELESDSR
jgi:hypothetical protein